MYLRGRSCTRHGQTSWLHSVWTPSRSDVHEEATRAFDELVRQAVPEALQRSFGCSGVPYVYLLVVLLPFMGEGFDAVGSEIARRSTFREAFLRCWYWFALHFRAGPMLVAVVILLSHRCYQGRDFLLKGYVALVWIAALLVTFGAQSRSCQICVQWSVTFSWLSVSPLH